MPRLGTSLPEDHRGLFEGTVVYVLDSHPLPMFFALVYLLDRRHFSDPETALAYIEELDKRQPTKRAL